MLQSLTCPACGCHFDATHEDVRDGGDGGDGTPVATCPECLSDVEVTR